MGGSLVVTNVLPSVLPRSQREMPSSLTAGMFVFVRCLSGPPQPKSQITHKNHNDIMHLVHCCTSTHKRVTTACLRCEPRDGRMRLLRMRCAPDTPQFDPLSIKQPPPTPPTPTSNEEKYSLPVQAALGALAVYRNVISPLMPARCRYVPSCSNYSIQAFKEFGLWRGGLLTAWRLSRCHPLGGEAWSYDPPVWPPPGLAFMYGPQYVYWLVVSNAAVLLAALWLHGDL